MLSFDKDNRKLLIAITILCLSMALPVFFLYITGHCQPLEKVFTQIPSPALLISSLIAACGGSFCCFLLSDKEMAGIATFSGSGIGFGGFVAMMHQFTQTDHLFRFEAFFYAFIGMIPGLLVYFILWYLKINKKPGILP